MTISTVSGLYPTSGFACVIFITVPTGSGFLPHAITLTRLLSSHGSMVVYVILSVHRFYNTKGITLAWKFQHDRLVSRAWSLPYQK
jgi:hypothetical protein